MLSLDPLSLPQQFALADDGTLASRSWTRLLRTPIGGGSLLRQNFVLVKSENAQHGAPESSSKENGKLNGSDSIGQNKEQIGQTAKTAGAPQAGT